MKRNGAMFHRYSRFRLRAKLAALIDSISSICTIAVQAQNEKTANPGRILLATFANTISASSRRPKAKVRRVLCAQMDCPFDC